MSDKPEKKSHKKGKKEKNKSSKTPPQKFLETALGGADGVEQVPDSLPEQSADRQGARASEAAEASENITQSHGYDEVKFSDASHVAAVNTETPAASHTYNEITFHEAGKLENNQAPSSLQVQANETYEIPSFQGQATGSGGASVPQPESGYMPLNLNQQQEQPEYSAPEVRKGPNRGRKILGSIRGRIESIRIRQSFAKPSEHSTDGEGERRTRDNWMLAFLLVSIAVGVFALLFSVIALGLGAKNRGNCDCDNLRSELNLSIQAQLLRSNPVLNCTRRLIASCALSTATDSSSFCETSPVGSSIVMTSSLSCGVQFSRQEERGSDSFFSILLSAEGQYWCECSRNMNVTTIDTDSRDIRCNMVAISCVV